MENAVKALVISATVLIVILIVSLGIYIYSKANEVEETESTLVRMETMMFNSQYQMYEGINNGGMVKKLLELAAQKNQELYKSQDTIKQCICIRSNVQEILDGFSNNTQMLTGLNGTRNYGVRYPSNIDQISKVVEPLKKYNVWFSYNDYGYIWEIHIDNL